MHSMLFIIVLLLNNFSVLEILKNSMVNQGRTISSLMAHLF